MKYMNRLLGILLAVSLIFTCGSTAVTAAEDKDFEIISERLTTQISASPSCNDYDASWLGLMDNEGKFTDLNYGDKMGRFDHIVRICSMAWQYSLPDGKLYKQQEALNKILLGFTFFTTQKYVEVGQSVNWTTNLEVPQYMAEVVIALRTVGVSVPQSLIDIMEEHHFDVHMRTTGNAIIFSLNTSNLAYTTALWKRIALVLRDESYIQKIYDYSTTAWTNHASGEYGVMAEDAGANHRSGLNYFGDGYYPDGTYYGHGPQLYTFGYGNQFISGNASLISLAAGTKYQVSQEKLQVLVDFMLNSMRWLMRGDNCDFPALGRSLTGTDAKRITDGRRSRAINYVSHLLQEPNIPRRAELEDFLAKLKTEQDMSYVNGNHQFWLSDTMAHHREGYFVSVNNSSVRKFKAERVGEQGVNNYYIADGVSPIYVTGKEYQDAFIVYDWDRLPGLTALQSDDDVPGLVDMSTTVSNHYGRTDFVGGASDGTYGVSAMDYLNDMDVTAKKSWFFFDDEFVALGAGITSKTSPDSLYTSINQCSLDGDVVYSDGTEEKVLATDTLEAPAGVQWVHHGNIGYVIPEEQKVFIGNRAQTGNGFRKDNTTSPYETRDIFSLYFDHGIRPSKTSYSYIAIPNAEKEAVKAYASEIPVEIVSNTPEIQAVYHKKLDILQAVFYEEGELTMSNGMKIGVDTPCILMLKRQEGGVAISVQNPRNEYAQIGITINEQFASDKAVWDEKTEKSTIRATTRNGLFSGESVQVNITSKLISNISYRPETDEILFDGIIPTSNARYIFAKITDKKGNSTIKSAAINADSSYSFRMDALDFFSGTYTVEMYCENDMEPLVTELSIQKENPVVPVIFPDTISHWVRDYAARLAVYGIIEGDQNGHCNPDDPLTLAQLAKLIVKTLSLMETELPEYVQDGVWDASVMQYVKENNLIPTEVLANGEDAGRYVTRQEMLTMVMRIASQFSLTANMPQTGGELPADMATANYWAYDSLKTAYELGIISGDGIGVKPFAYANRGECIKILEKIVSNMQ